MRNEKFFYPSNVGNLDREDKGLLKVMIEKEFVKAAKISEKKFSR